MKNCITMYFLLVLATLLIGCSSDNAAVTANQVPEDLNGVSGKIFHVNMNAKSFELLKETVIDPKTNEGRSRHTIYWTDDTKFQKVSTQKTFKDITGPIVTVFSNMRGNDPKLIKDGKPFCATIAHVFPEVKKATGLSKDGKTFSAWFTPDKDNLTKGTVKIGDKQVQVSLLTRRPRRKVIITSKASPNDIAKGFWNTTINGKYVNGRFTLDSLTINPLTDPRTVDDPKLPRVLVIGDSISMNYHNSAKAALKGKANYYRNEGNGGPTTRGIVAAELWLGDYKTKGLHWDIIQFNHGLHDIVRSRDPETKAWNPTRISIEDYKKNLEKIIPILQKTGAKLIWCTTTPVPSSGSGSYCRRKGDPAKYNKAALEVISKYPDIRINDIYTFIDKSSDFDKWRKGTDVHFWSRDLSEIVGKKVAEGISKVLKE